MVDTASLTHLAMAGEAAVETATQFAKVILDDLE